jgi:hypothetical protein
LQIPQIVQTRTPNLAPLDHLNLLDSTGMERKNPLNTDAVGDLPNREGSERRSCAAIDYDAFKNLDALFIAFLDQGVHANAVTGIKFRQVDATEGIFEFL